MAPLSTRASFVEPREGSWCPPSLPHQFFSTPFPLLPVCLALLPPYVFLTTSCLSILPPSLSLTTSSLSFSPLSVYLSPLPPSLSALSVSPLPVYLPPLPVHLSPPPPWLSPLQSRPIFTRPMGVVLGFETSSAPPGWVLQHKLLGFAELRFLIRGMGMAARADMAQTRPEFDEHVQYLAWSRTLRDDLRTATLAWTAAASLSAVLLSSDRLTF